MRVVSPKPKTDPTTARPGRGAPLAQRFTPEKRQRFLEIYRTGTTVAAAARKVGISSVTVFNYIRSDEAFGLAYRAALETNTDALEDGLHTLARNGNIAAIFGTLKARRPERWRDRVDVSNQDGSLLKPLAEAIRRAHSAPDMARANDPDTHDRGTRVQ